MILRSGIVAAATPLSLYIRPSAYGAMDGSSWGNALSLSSLPTCVSAVGPGGTIYIAADDGPYTINSSLNSLTLSRSSSQGAATVKGINMDGTTGKAVMNSTRKAFVAGVNYNRTDPDNDGYDVFILPDQTTGLTLSHFNFTNVGNGFLFLANASTIAITDCDATNSYMLVDAERTVAGGVIANGTYAISSLTIARLTSTGYEMGLFNSAANMTGFTATDLLGDSQGNYGQAFTEGFHLGGTVPNPVCTNIECKNNFYNNRGSVYWNGDGIVTEGGVSGAVWTNAKASGNDDGGIDTKEENATYNNTVVKRNKKNLKYWSTTGGTHNDLVSTNPIKNGGTDNTQHVLFAGGAGDATWTFNRPVMCNTGGNVSTFFRCEKSVGSIMLNLNDWNMTRTKTTFSISGTDTLNDSGNELADIPVDGVIWLSGCANAANNDVPLLVTASSSGALSLTQTDGSAAGLTNETAGSSITVRWGIWTDPDATFSSTSSRPLTINWSPAMPAVSGLTVTWRSGKEAGFVDEATVVGDVLADLSVTTSNLTGTMRYRIKSDADGKFAIVGNELRLAAVLNPTVKTKHTCTIQAYDPSGIASSSQSVTIYANATTLDTDAAAFDTALQGAGLAYLTDGSRRRWRATYDNFFRLLKSGMGADYSQFDHFMAPCSYDQSVHKRNLKQNAYHQTWNGSPIWSAKQPWTGNGTDAWIDFSFNPTTASSPNYARNSAHLLAHKTGSNVAETVFDIGVDHASVRMFVIARRADNLTQAGLNSNSTHTQASTDSRIWFGANRTSSTSYGHYQGSAFSTVTDSSIAPGSGAMKAGGHATAIGINPHTAGGYDWLSFGGGFTGGATTVTAIKTAQALFLEMAALAE